MQRHDLGTGLTGFFSVFPALNADDVDADIEMSSPVPGVPSGTVCFWFRTFQIPRSGPPRHGQGPRRRSRIHLLIRPSRPLCPGRFAPPAGRLFPLCSSVVNSHHQVLLLGYQDGIAPVNGSSQRDRALWTISAWVPTCGPANHPFRRRNVEQGILNEFESAQGCVAFQPRLFCGRFMSEIT